MEKEKGYCPYCGEEAFPEDETICGIFCSCRHDFWFSEALPEGYKEKGCILLNDCC